VPRRSCRRRGACCPGRTWPQRRLGTSSIVLQIIIATSQNIKHVQSLHRPRLYTHFINVVANSSF
jgi:hypothetical protein